MENHNRVMVELYLGDSFGFLESYNGGKIDLFNEDMPYFKTGLDFDKQLTGKTIDYRDSEQIRYVNSYLDKYWNVRERVASPTAVFVLTSVEPFTTVLKRRFLHHLVDEFIWRKANLTNPMMLKKKIGRAHENVSVFAVNPSKYTFNRQYRSGKPYKGFESKNGKTVGKVLGKAKSMHKENAGVRTEISVQEYAQEFLGMAGLEQNPDMVKFMFAFLQYLQENNINLLENNDDSVVKFARECGLHDVQKPVGLMEMAIKWFSNEGDLVFDGYAGSGTTLVSCLRTNRNGIGVEVNEFFYSKAKDRIDSEKLKLFENEANT